MEMATWDLGGAKGIFSSRPSDVLSEPLRHPLRHHRRSEANHSGHPTPPPAPPPLPSVSSPRRHWVGVEWRSPVSPLLSM
ncbi:hypothetical protein ACP70R_014670 [Stipagrostis hirtigluma subsp. patula]